MKTSAAFSLLKALVAPNAISFFMYAIGSGDSGDIDEVYFTLPDHTTIPVTQEGLYGSLCTAILDNSEVDFNNDGGSLVVAWANSQDNLHESLSDEDNYTSDTLLIHVTTNYTEDNPPITFTHTPSKAIQAEIQRLYRESPPATSASDQQGNPHILVEEWGECDQILPEGLSEAAHQELSALLMKHAEESDGYIRIYILDTGILSYDITHQTHTSHTNNDSSSLPEPTPLAYDVTLEDYKTVGSLHEGTDTCIDSPAAACYYCTLQQPTTDQLAVISKYIPDLSLLGNPLSELIPLYPVLGICALLNPQLSEDVRSPLLGRLRHALYGIPWATIPLTNLPLLSPLLINQPYPLTQLYTRRDLTPEAHSFLMSLQVLSES